MIQDIYPHIYSNTYQPSQIPTDHDIILSFEDDQVLLKNNHEFYTYSQTGNARQYYFLFSIDQTNYFLSDLSDLPHHSVSFRKMRTFPSPVLGFAAITGWQLYQWIQHNRFCGKCGHPLDYDKNERAMHCSQCGNTIYPKISPAVIVGITNDQGQILVTKYAHGSYQNYALVAGFCEIGETVEETVKREVKEETGLDVTDIQYYKSQPWSFSSTLLLGFWCKVHGDDTIRMDMQELRVARWANRSEDINSLDNSSLTTDMIQYYKQGKVI